MKARVCWPQRGQKVKIISKKIEWALGENIDYRDELIIGFPGTEPDPISVEAFTRFLSRHPNNICTHTSGESEKGFAGTQTLEKESVLMVGDLLGSESVDGYITPGGTESNIVGMLLGRERLLSIPSAVGEKYCIITSFFSHYSIRKAAWVLGLGRDDWRTCPKCTREFGKEMKHVFQSNEDGSGVHLIGTDEAGRISVNQLERIVRENYVKGIRRFIIVASEGNIITGAVDNTKAIGEMIVRSKEVVPEAGFHLHVDAAFGGFVVPFICPEKRFSFYVPEVDSLGVDAHKMGETPYPSGMFLYRKDGRNLRNLLGVLMGYVPGETDGTLCGSRSGASAAACYALFKRRGHAGYKARIDSCMENAQILRQELAKIQDVEPIPGDTNIVAFRIRGARTRELSKKFILATMLVHHHFPENFRNPNDHVKMIYKATVMPHVTVEKIGKFVALLKKDLMKV